MPETLTDKIKGIASGIPPEVKRFVIKGAALLIGWCLLYGMLLKPFDLLDPTLTRYTAKATVLLTEYFYQSQQVVAIYTTRAVTVIINNRKVLYICEPCNGLDLYVLFIGFILCVPMGIKKMATYILIGLASIFVLNVLRCLALLSLFYHHSGYADIAHHYIFQFIVYAAIFLVWERYFRSFKVNHETAPV